MIAVSAALLAGCTDPSPELTDQPDPTPSASSEASTSSGEPDEPSEEASEDATVAAPEPPVFGTAANQPGGAATACVEGALGAPLTFSTVLTAVDAITLDSLVLDPGDGGEVETLDQYVLPFTGGAGGLAVGDYPPADPGSAREDIHFYRLDAGRTVVVGVGVSAQTQVTMTFVLTYHGVDGVERTVRAPHAVTIADSCTPAEPDPAETASDSG